MINIIKRLCKNTFIFNFIPPLYTIINKWHPSFYTWLGLGYIAHQISYWITIKNLLLVRIGNAFFCLNQHSPSTHIVQVSGCRENYISNQEVYPLI